MRRAAYLLRIFLLNILPQTVVSQEDTSKYALEILEPYIRRYDRQALATCEGHWDTEDKTFLHQVPWAVTQWTLPSKHFLRYLDANAGYGITTNVILRSLGRGVPSCLMASLSRLRAFRFADWFVIEGSDEAKDLFKKYVATSSRTYFPCDVTGSTTHKPNGKTSVRRPQVVNVSLYTRACRQRYRGVDTGFLGANHLRNSVIIVGCRSPAEGSVQCGPSRVLLALDALRRYNVSIRWSFDASYSAVYKKFINGDSDVLSGMFPPYEELGRVADLSVALEEQYEAFYYRRGESTLVSAVDIIIESNLAISLLLVALVCAILVLAIADLKETNAWNSGSLIDSFLFLIASFYATAANVPRRWRWPITRAIVYSVWLLAILPLSNYIRSELVSRLSLRSPADVVDTLGELELALDRRTVIPCFLRGTVAYENIRNNRSDIGFYAKLNLALNARKDRWSLAKVNGVDCLWCARKNGYVCLMQRVPECILRREVPDLRESQDKLHIVFLSMPVQKSFVLKDAFRNFMRRIAETSKPHDCPYWEPMSELRDEYIEPNQINELSRFFAFFGMFLGCCGVVFVLELIIGNRKIFSTISFVSRAAVGRLKRGY